MLADHLIGILIFEGVFGDATGFVFEPGVHNY